MVTKERWSDLLNRIGCRSNSDPYYSRLVAAYGEKHRHYHNLRHIEQCLFEFDQVKSQLDAPDLVELAIWYHDVIYGTRSHSNEDDSAFRAGSDLRELEIAEDAIERVLDLIVATKHSGEPLDSDSRYLIDIDLSILGAAPAIFQKYETNIRKEYKWVPLFLFRKKRAEILRSFISRKHIFYTGVFREKYERQARINLSSVLSAQ